MVAIASNMKSEEFKSLCRRLFVFLEDEYGCCRTEGPFENPVVPVDFDAHTVRYENSTTAVTIHYEPYERLPCIHIRRLNGNREGFNFGFLILATQPELDPLAFESGLPLKQSPGELLEKYAYALKLIGQDVLRGNFDIFPRLAEIKAVEIQKRLNRDPSFKHF
jgi:hypothetical protein